MAKPNPLLLLPLLTTTILLITSTITNISQACPIAASLWQLKQGEKVTHLHFYFHDIVSGDNPSAVIVAEAAATKASDTSFGFVAIMDNALTEGPEMSSKLVGRAQGMYASADKREVGLLMNVNFVFTEGEFNGSSVSLFGRNQIMSPVREMPIVGGTGDFRFARGYAEARTHMFDRKSGDAVVEYYMYIWHY